MHSGCSDIGIASKFGESKMVLANSAAVGRFNNLGRRGLVKAVCNTNATNVNACSRMRQFGVGHEIDMLTHRAHGITTIPDVRILGRRGLAQTVGIFTGVYRIDV